VAPDGRFLANLRVTGGEVDDTAPPRPQINIVLNWFEELKERLPTGR